MTKKDYELIARIFAKNMGEKATEGRTLPVKTVVEATARQFADVLSRENTRFDKDKFLKACGIQD